MTAKTYNFSGLLYYNPAGPGFNAVPQVTIYCPDSMDEGSTITVNLVTWGIPDRTVLYHTFPLSGTNLTPLRFNVSPHPTVVNNRASFTVTVNADSTTSPDGQSFDIVIKKTLAGPALATKYGINVNDTSQTYSPPQSLVFNGTSDYREVAGTTSDWALGTTWTIEYWSKASTATISNGAGLWTVPVSYTHLTLPTNREV